MASAVTHFAARAANCALRRLRSRLRLDPIDIDPVPEDLRPEVDALAAEAGIPADALDLYAHQATPIVRMQIHLARALALSPSLLLLEHPTAPLEAADRTRFAEDVARVVDARDMTLLACSQDREFARRVATRHLQLHPGTGALTDLRT